MKLYLLRHAEAYPTSPDEARALTNKGKRTVVELAKELGEKQLLPNDVRVLCSPLVRARETADILCSELKLANAPEPIAAITPDDDERTIMAKLTEMSGAVMLVGHNPHLSYLTTRLLRGPESYSLVKFPKAGLVHLVREYEGHLASGEDALWQLRWMLRPW